MKEDNAQCTMHRSATQGDASLAKNSQCTMHEAQWRHQDKNLREALRQEEANLPPMPADLNERLQQRLSASGRGRGVRLLFLAAAACIALLIVFNLGKRRSPQEPVVAQQTEKLSAVPSQPIVEEPQPEVVSDEQPVEKPARLPVVSAPSPSWISHRPKASLSSLPPPPICPRTGATGTVLPAQILQKPAMMTP